ncbi:MAG: dTMP kinase [Deltaproteobacteria bacterium]|jgi:dTMP kinase|nr:dTMP kinase [Deltaproteobacteria bacterium]
MTELQPFDRSLFLAFEGLDGSGKTTQANLLSKTLAAVLDPGPLLLKEPTYGPAGLRLRQLALGSDASLTASEEMDLFLEDRRHDVANNINPALRNNRTVIIDRYILSNAAYQGARGRSDPKDILKANQSFPVPNLTFLLELPLEKSLERIQKRGGDSTYFENPTFLAKVKDIYDSIDYPGLVRIDADRDIAEIGGDILVRLRESAPALIPEELF